MYLLFILVSIQCVFGSILSQHYASNPLGGVLGTLRHCYEFFDLNETGHEMMQFVDGLVDEHLGPEGHSKDGVRLVNRTVAKVMDCWRQVWFCARHSAPDSRESGSSFIIENLALPAPVAEQLLSKATADRWLS